MVNSNTGILLSNKNHWGFDTVNTMSETELFYAKWNEPDFKAKNCTILFILKKKENKTTRK